MAESGQIDVYNGRPACSKDRRQRVAGETSMADRGSALFQGGWIVVVVLLLLRNTNRSSVWRTSVMTSSNLSVNTPASIPTRSWRARYRSGAGDMR